MDLLGFGAEDVTTLKEKFLAIIHIQENDGLVFQPEKMRVQEIKEDANYQGIRITGRAKLIKAEIPYQIDIGFGDAVKEVEDTTEIPIFLDDLPTPKMKIYPVETVIAEKFQAMVVLGLANSRMKDFFDVVTFASTMPLESDELRAAIHATFERRDTKINNKGLYIFSDEFKTSPDKQRQWQAFVRKNNRVTAGDFKIMIEKIQELLEPIYLQINSNRNENKIWDANVWRWK